MKESPFNLTVKPLRRLARTFTNFADPRFTCSCGKSFNSADPVFSFLDGNPTVPPPCPAIKEEEDGTTHVVAENPPSKKFDMEFRRVGVMDAMAIQENVDVKARDYLKTFNADGTSNRPKITLPPVGGMPVKMSKTACLTAGILEDAQIPNPGDGRYTFEELVSFLMSDSICNQMGTVSQEVQQEEDASPLASPAES